MTRGNMKRLQESINILTNRYLTREIEAQDE